MAPADAPAACRAQARAILGGMTTSAQIIHQGRSRDWPHDRAFDPTYGYDRDALLAIRPPDTEPPDFDAFWRATYAENEALPLDYELEEVPSGDPEQRAWKVGFLSFGGGRSYAWLVEPRARPAIGVVIGHGYGGREGFDLGRQALDGDGDRDVARIYPVARGFHISAREDLPLNDAAGHVVHGIAQRETYVIRGCVAEQWTCARILLDRHPQLAGRLCYSGGSFGGGLGALMLPWDQRFVAAHLDVPTFGHHPIRLRCPCGGSGESVRRYHDQHPEVEAVLAYYDAATAATRIRIPVLAGAALFDPSVPPPGQFAVTGALAGETVLFIKSMGHFDHPDVADEGPKLAAAVGRFLRAQVLR